MDRASRADTPSAANTAMVAINVLSGWCQNSHTIVSAESAKIAQKTTMLALEYDKCVMPASGIQKSPVALYMFSRKTPISRGIKNYAEFAWRR
jgi:hypothetical protein